jgi:hypothetical protein
VQSGHCSDDQVGSIIADGRRRCGEDLGQRNRPAGDEPRGSGNRCASVFRNVAERG